MAKKKQQQEKMKNDKGKPSFVVGMGASAGGLKALDSFFSHMRSDSGMAFVVVQHLDPHHESLMKSLLAKQTSMRVQDAKDGLPVEPNHVYIRPPGKDITIKELTLHLSKAEEKGESSRLPIDTFFRSLAEDAKERAIAIVLSGASSDGTLGAKLIKGEGGMVVAQDDKEAEYPRMPRSIIDARLADFILPVQGMPEELLRYAGHPLMIHEPEAPAEEKSDQSVQRILMIVRTSTGHDFSQYKRNTVCRRIERRMALHQIQEMQDYAKFLRQDPQEVTDLFKDLTINVTSFFRDHEAFLSLKEKGIKPMLLEKPADSTVRVWVPGCATGEEAYSLAILLTEASEELEKYLQFKVFATDINSEAIEVARSGLFPDNIAADLSEERLRRFFAKKGSRYQVDSKIRDMVVFALHDVTRDPPFSNLDLVACRNLLIYMDNDLQKKVLPILHYALKSGGMLFLGTSESVGEAVDLFETIDKRNKIYKGIPVEMERIHRFQVPPVFLRDEDIPDQKAIRIEQATGKWDKRNQVREIVERAIIQKYASPAVLVDENSDILYFLGNTGKFLSPPSGEANFNLFNMVAGELHFRLSQGLAEVKRSREGLNIGDIQVRHNDDFFPLEVVLSPLSVGKKKNWVLVEFKEQKPALLDQPKRVLGQEQEGEQKDLRLVELEHKLKSSQHELQATIEELETSNEELRSANEELQANNEELQSTNEELESSKEELQSTNEELETVNSELFRKNEDLVKAEDDLNNLFASNEVGTIFLDDRLCIKRFTPAAKEVFNLKENADIGRRISDITSNLDYSTLDKDAEEVLDKLNRKEIKVSSKDGKAFIVRISPYRTSANVIDGVIITFVDVTELGKLERSAKGADDFIYKIMSALWDPVLILDKGYKVFAANRAFYRMFKTSPNETISQSVFELGNQQWDIPDLRRFLEEIIPMDNEFEGYEVEHDLPMIGRRKMSLNARKIAGGEDSTDMILLTFRDVTAEP